MKKINLVLCSFLILLMTGCSVKYELNFNNHSLREAMTIDANDWSSDQIEQTLEEYENESLTENYKISFNKETKKIKLSKEYSISSYANSSILRQCYTAYNFLESDEYYDLTTSNTFNCNPFDYIVVDEVKVQIKTNHKVLNHNADYVENNTYVWVIDKENSGNKPIQIRFSKDMKNNYIGLIILGIIVIIILILLLMLFIKRKKSNNL